MKLTVSILLLCVPPIVLFLAIGGTIEFVKKFRRGFGCHRPLPAAACVAAAVAMLLHAGYIFAPLLLYTHHVGLALWLVAPMTVIGSTGLIWLIVVIAGARDAGRRNAIALFGLLVAYLMSPAVLILNIK